jgi:hypothetical protein
MAYKRKRVGEISTTVWVLGGVAVVGIIFLAMNASKTAAPPVVLRTIPNTSAATTAAEIAAGASVVNTLVNDLTPDEEDS